MRGRVGTMRAFGFWLVILLPLALPAEAWTPDSPWTIGCRGPFAPTATRETLAAQFGARNLVDSDVPVEASTVPGTILFPARPDRRLEILWQGEAPHRILAVRIPRGSAWRTSQGIGLGESLRDVERRNGRPFLLLGFADEGGMVEDWRGGALRALPDRCRLRVRFTPDRRVVRGAVFGNADAWLSSDRRMRAVSPRVVELGLDYGN